MADPVQAVPENVRSATTLQSRQSEHMSRPILSSTFSLTPTKSSLNTELNCIVELRFLAAVKHSSFDLCHNDNKV